MIITSAVASILGLILVVVAGVVLLRNIFITDEELNRLAELPIEQSTTNMTGAITHANLPVAVTDVVKLLDYRKSYIEARKIERKNGRIGLWLLVIGSLLQIVGVTLSALA
jgi:hypothetical protein